MGGYHPDSIILLFNGININNDSNTNLDKNNPLKLIKMTMTITINETVTREVEIEFPHYTTDGLHFFKFKDEHSCTQAVGSEIIGGFKIETSVNFPTGWMLLAKITEQEFNNKFNETIKILIDGNK